MHTTCCCLCCALGGKTDCVPAQALGPTYLGRYRFEGIHSHWCLDVAHEQLRATQYDAVAAVKAVLLSGHDGYYWG